MQKISQNGTMFQKLLQYMQMCLTFAPREMQQAIYQDMMMVTGGQMPMGTASPQIAQGDSINGLKQQEHGVVRNARARSQNASQPDAGQVKEVST